MGSFNHLMETYSRYHQNSLNIFIHKLAVPLIYFCSIGLIHQIPTPWDASSFYFIRLSLFPLIWLNFIYLRFHFFYGAILTLFSLLCYIINLSLMRIPNFLPLISLLSVFILAWTLQIWGHMKEGNKPALTENLLLMLAAPMWTLHGHKKG